MLLRHRTLCARPGGTAASSRRDRYGARDRAGVGARRRCHVGAADRINRSRRDPI